MSTDKLYKTDGFCFTPLKCFDNFRHSHVRALGLVGLAALFDGLFQDDVLDLHQSDRVGTLVFIELHRDILDALLHLRNFHRRPGIPSWLLPQQPTLPCLIFS